MDALFLKIANMGITVTWLVLAVLIIRLVFKKAPKWLHCGLWGLVAFRLICPFSIESVLSLVPSSTPLPEGIIYATEPQIQSGITLIDRPINVYLAETMRPDPVESANPMQIITFILAIVWLVGVVAMLIYSAVSYIVLRFQVRTSVPLDKNIRQCDCINSPFVLGVFRPMIYLPFGLNEETMVHVIAHEKAHISRRDYLWKPIGFLLLSVYWFNPILWVAYIFLCRDIEAACDEKVIKGMGKEELRAYSTALLQCSIKKRSITACPVAFGETNVKKRITDIINYKKPAFWIILLALVACVVVAICFMTNPVDKPVVQVEATPTPQISQPVETTTTPGPESEQTIILQTMDGADLYIYEKGGFGSNFTISLKNDGTFSYYEGSLSSYIGIGEYTVDNDRLILFDRGMSREEPWIFEFTIDDGKLIFDKSKSHDFIYVHPDDGAAFYLSPQKESHTTQLFDTSTLEEDEYDLLLESMKEIEAIVQEAFAPREDVSDFVHVLEPYKNGTQKAYIVNVNCTLTAAREPEDDPVIIGMYQAMEQYKDEEQKKKAQKIIDGYVVEMKRPGDRSQWSIRVKVIIEDGKYELKYTYVKDGLSKDIPLEEYLKKEDREQRIRLGIETLNDNMKTGATHF
ncbi:MAG: M56 family metallopeptidase [Lachnospiraceae bacterium]|nr:M56 family metallopeptidase [Lachnospiraceae bacterium]